MDPSKLKPSNFKATKPSTNCQSKKEQLASKFAQLNSSLRSKASDDSSNSTNIFMDILKVAHIPVVDLGDEDERLSVTCTSDNASMNTPRNFTNESVDMECIEIIENSNADNEQPCGSKLSLMGKTAKTSSSHTVTPENFNRSGFSSAYGNDLTKTALKRLRRKSRKSVEQARKRALLSQTDGNHSSFTVNNQLKERTSNHLNKSANDQNKNQGDEDDDIVFVQEVQAINYVATVTRTNDATEHAGRISPEFKNRKKLASLATFVSRMRPCMPSATIAPNKYNLFGLRYFEEIKGAEVPTAGHFSKYNLSVVTYNVLCQSTINRTMYLYRHLRGERSKYLTWLERSKLLVIEFDRLQADVFCLQEVEEEHFIDFFQPYFAQRGFIGLYNRRTNNFPDGCAIFYSTKLFKFIASVDVTFNLKKNGMDRDNVGQIVVLEIFGTRTQICVSNTHVLFNMRRGDVKLNQCEYLLNRLSEVEESIRAQASSSGKTFAGHILCGDFNIEPFSPIYNFIVEGCIKTGIFSASNLAFEMECLDLQEAAAGSCIFTSTDLNAKLMESYMGVGPGKGSPRKKVKEITHCFSFASVYEHKLVDGTKEISTYHKDAGCPDFIFYSVAATKSETNSTISEAFLRLRKRLSLPCHRDLHNSCGPLPNEQAGSDHLPLMAQFEVLCAELH
ncbi:endonuclease/Exonuclease/phosphatase family domain-containing protein [Ditylenchus destructor]|uniref:Endonuclease/Exonuclease/phosphatase family domain-containing protein n=1 Tax=Ditylenchus destructor TaxID=166010 RepID=A0AAD4NKG2_9BILA|nr:endonuclease/Exonuclease/phosphatase family domain-containing protein [Ditylenchus destructor]